MNHSLDVCGLLFGILISSLLDPGVLILQRAALTRVNRGQAWRLARKRVGIKSTGRPPCPVQPCCGWNNRAVYSLGHRLSSAPGQAALRCRQARGKRRALHSSFLPVTAAFPGGLRGTVSGFRAEQGDPLGQDVLFWFVIEVK